MSKNPRTYQAPLGEKTDNPEQFRHRNTKPHEKPKHADEQKHKQKHEGLKHPRPTHFLALPLHNFPELQKRVSAFQNALFRDSDSPTPIVTVSLNSNANPNARTRKPVKTSTVVQGLDRTIVIDPRRLHMTLGVMSLEPDSDPSSSPAPADESPEGTAPDSNINNTPKPGSSRSKAKERRTPTTALQLLRSLLPQIKEILRGDAAVRVPLEVMDVLKTERIRLPQPVPSNANSPPLTPVAGRSKTDVESTGQYNDVAVEKGSVPDQNQPSKVGAGVLFLGPAPLLDSGISEDRRKLKEVCDLVHRRFKQAGYITEQRPLKLHCTILNASHRKPMRRMPFCYSDILALEDACGLIAVSENGQDTIVVAPETTHVAVGPRTASTSTVIPTTTVIEGMTGVSIRDKPHPTDSARATHAQLRPQHPQLVVPPPLHVNLGTYDVQSIELWVMGSRNENNEYVSLGGVSLR